MSIIVIAHNIRSTHNVGAIFRTAEGFGIEKIICSGYTPYPALINGDPRLPHLREKITKQIHKTALGAETLVPFERCDKPPLTALRQAGYSIIGLEQDEQSIPLQTYHPTGKVALLLGEEVDGICQELRSQCDGFVEIPMAGKKESFNVSVAAGIALYQLCVR
ncbi:MAG: TrmH family RNA methyltransferase [Candidatus Saccharibacteria bacterium]|nr:TrmH family RNA methyltransferase [Candidatus Saccharibacteria bacterium]